MLNAIDATGTVENALASTSKLKMVHQVPHRPLKLSFSCPGNALAHVGRTGDYVYHSFKSATRSQAGMGVFLGRDSAEKQKEALWG